MTGMNSDLRDRLRRLGVHKGAANLKSLKPSPEAQAEQLHRSAAERRSEHTSIPESALASTRTPYGLAYSRKADYALDHQHGNRALASALAPAPEFVAQFAFRHDAEAVTMRDALFLDTETTGLAGGAGTLAFMVGLGYFEDERFIVEQFFLRDPAQEAAMLCEIDRRVNRRAHLVTFNGRVFDIPLLETRYTLARIAPSFEDMTHLDLLLPARRVWRGSLESCSLGSLEYHLLGVERTQRDVPGAIIPLLYRQYLAAGGGDLNEDMQRVMYHNLHDILSMVTLTARLADAILQPGNEKEQFAAARYHERARAFDDAERGYRKLLWGAEGKGVRDSVPASPAALHFSVHRRLARMLKRQGRAIEAIEHWRALADTDDVEGLLEMAKHYEWREHDLHGALACALRASRVSEDMTLRAEISKRVERLEKKVASQTSNVNRQTPG
jgi:uncharacterized protein YprB with RNaseH-like and TPR domain